MRSVLVHLGTVSVPKIGYVAGKFYNCQLHAIAETQKGHLVLPGVADGPNFSSRVPAPKTARHYETIVLAKIFPVTRIYPIYNRPLAKIIGSVFDGLYDRDISISKDK